MVKTILKDDGERMIPEHHKGGLVYGEHIIRYNAAKEIVKDKVVLDIASGSGYGTALLAETAKKVYGVDIDENSVSYAKENYGKKNIEYKVGSGTDIPLSDGSVDVVVTYETIEHIKDYKKFLAETKRVLKKDGLLLVSTPNDVEFIEGNHFHVHEFEYKELSDLLGKYYKQSKSWFQGDWLASGILNLDQMNSEWEKNLSIMNVSPKGVNQSIYFFILCSDRPITEEVTPLFSLSEHWSTRSSQEHEIRQKNEKNELEIANQEKAHKLEETNTKLELVRHELSVANQEIDAIKGSRSWKLIKKVAAVKSKAHHLKKKRK